MGACLSSPYLAPVTLPVRHLFRAFASDLSKEQRIAFSNEFQHPHCSGVNYMVWRRSALLLTCVLQLACGNASTLIATDAYFPESCSDPVAAAAAVDTLRTGVDALHVVCFGLSMLLLTASVCFWEEHKTSNRVLVVSFALRVLVPYVMVSLPWFDFLSYDCPQYRAYGSAILAAPILSIILGILPGLVRAARLVNSVVPGSSVPLLFMRVGPALFLLAAGGLGAVIYQLLGSVLLVFGLIGVAVCGLVFVRMSYVLEDAKHGRAAANISTLYRLTHLLVFLGGGLLILIYLIVTSNSMVDTWGAVPATLPIIPGVDFYVTFGLAYVVDMMLSSVLFSDFLVIGFVTMRKREKYMLDDPDCRKLVELVADQPGAPNLGLGPSGGSRRPRNGSGRTASGRAASRRARGGAARGAVQQENPAVRAGRDGSDDDGDVDPDAVAVDVGGEDGPGADAGTPRGGRSGPVPPHARQHKPRRAPRSRGTPRGRGRGRGRGGRR